MGINVTGIGVCGSASIQRRISCADIQVSPISIWDSPSAALNVEKPSAAQRSMQRCATSRWMVVNSNDRALTGLVSPASTSASKPSTSILMKAGVPWRAMSVSSVVTGMRIMRVQRCPSHPGAPSAASTKAADTVEMVGLSTLMRRSARPMDEPTRTGFDHDIALAAVEQAQDPHQSRLRLDRDHARTEAAEACDAVADMRADVEGEVAADG